MANIDEYYAELGRLADRIMVIPCGSLIRRKGKSKYCISCKYSDFCKIKTEIIKSEADNGRRKRRCGREV